MVVPALAQAIGLKRVTTLSLPNRREFFIDTKGILHDIECMKELNPLSILQEIPEAYGLEKEEVDQLLFLGVGLESIARLALDRMALKLLEVE